MVAARNLKDAPRIGKLALLHILDPGAIDGQRYVVFRLARYRASVATDALAVINDESVSHEWGRVGGGWPIHINKGITSLLVGIGSEVPNLVLQAPSLQSFKAVCTAVDRSLDLRNLNQQ